MKSEARLDHRVVVPFAIQPRRPDTRYYESWALLAWTDHGLHILHSGGEVGFSILIPQTGKADESPPGVDIKLCKTLPVPSAGNRAPFPGLLNGLSDFYLVPQIVLRPVIGCVLISVQSVTRRFGPWIPSRSIG